MLYNLVLRPINKHIDNFELSELSGTENARS